MEEYILPLMMQSLTDFEEFVVEKVLRALTSLAELRLIMKVKLKELVSNILPLLYHPNPWIRAGMCLWKEILYNKNLIISTDESKGTASFLAQSVKCLPLLDVRCIIYPMIRPFLSDDVLDITASAILDNLKPEV